MQDPSRADDVLTPSQLNILARNLLEDAFPLVWIEGELGNVARPASGHLYLTLKDARAQVRAAMFKPKSSWLKFVPREGMHVLARGRITLYEARGEYQMVLDHMEEAGEGARRRAFEQLKARLQSEGLFDEARKRGLPTFPRRIGVLTSPTGAAVRDVLSVLARRFPLLSVDVLPVPVQGDAAAAQIRAMLERAIASGRHDLLVLARGGGSLEDLWAFNDEQLARAIAASPIPVVSAIGHETDFSLSDFAADLRAPTPSVAAELIAPDRDALAQRLARLRQRIGQQHRHALRAASQRLDRAALRLEAQRPSVRLALLRSREREARRRLDAALAASLQTAIIRTRHAGSGLRAQAPARRLAQLAQRLNALKSRPHTALQARLQADRHRLAGLRQRPRAALQARMQVGQQRLVGLARALSAISPLATVARGYSILSREDGTLVRRMADAPPGTGVTAQLVDGELRLQALD